jgi:hypothetical protein
MSLRTFEVELEDGRIRACGSESLPAKAHGLLTVLDSSTSSPVQTCAELASRWSEIEKLPAEEATAFADDIERSRGNLPPLKSAWD